MVTDEFLEYGVNRVQWPKELWLAMTGQNIESGVQFFMH